MIEVRQTQRFSAWLHRLRDPNAVARIVACIRRTEHGESRGHRKHIKRAQTLAESL